MAETFCVLPWSQLIVRTDGSTQICNRHLTHLAANGRRLSVHRYSLDEIWNSDDLQAMRRRMLRGDRLAACRQCYDEERAGGASLRLHMNGAWCSGFLNEEGRDLDVFRAEVAAADGRAAPPRFFQLDVGSLCNLKCRMCNSGASSQINLDPVQSRWTGKGLPLAWQRHCWFNHDEIVRAVLRYPDQVRQLHIIGGEPFLIKEVGGILQSLIDAGVAANIELSLHTNATTTRCSWLDLARPFKRLSLWISVDGIGPYYEYIRYPATWTRLVENIAVLRALPNAVCTAHVVVQIYNALNVVDLFTYFDEIDLQFFPHLLYTPSYLRATAMPSAARALAAGRLRAYAEHGCRPPQRDRVLSLVSYLDHAPDMFDEPTMRQFMLFTNDLDASRGQAFRDTHVELFDLIQAAGFRWSADTLYASETPGRTEPGGHRAGIAKRRTRPASARSTDAPAPP